MALIYLLLLLSILGPFYSLYFCSHCVAWAGLELLGSSDFAT